MEAAAGKSEMEEVLGGGTKFTSGDGQPLQEDQEQVEQQEEQEEQEEREEDANFGRQSFAYKKLKNMHEQPSQQDKKRGDDGDQADLLEGEYPPSQLFDAIEILNERKFNKPAAQSTDQARSQLQKKEKKDQAVQEHQKSRQVDEAIGDIDIEDNLDNDEILPTNNSEDEDDGDGDGDGDGNDDDEDEDIRSAIDNDELGRKYPVATSTTTKVPTTLATSKTTSSGINSISSTTTITPTTASATSTTATSPTTTTTTTTPRAAAPTIGRKLKRNFFGPAQPETRYYGSYDIGRIRAQAQEEDTTEEEKDEDVGELHYYDTSSGSSGSSGSSSRKLVSFEPEKSEENYLSSYYPGKLNATEKKQQRPQQHVVARQQHATRYVDDDYAEQRPPAEKIRLENPWEKSDEKPEDAEQPEDGKLESDLESALQRYHEATTTTPTVSAGPSSAFERFKALRRSRQRTGHKSHKKRYKDYLKRQPANVEVTSPPEAAPAATISTRHLQKLQKERERSTHSAPIFALGLRPQRNLLATGKPFYEGQVNYYDNQQQVDVDLKHHTEMERLIAHDNGNWYRRISPVLRNGVKSDPPAKEHHHHHHHSGQHLGNHHHHHHHSHSHHHGYNHNGAHNHHHHSPSHQKLGHPKSRPRNPYQRKVSMGTGVPSPPPPPTPPLPPPKPQLGHQITELEHLERYYAKWPHLARVQFQVYDEHYRETHPELYSDYEDDYESAAELEEAQQEHGEEANLPPYIKKYNRRNKQLLNLLEGTLPTPTLSNPGNPLGSTETVRLDDEYLKEKRRRYHQHQRFEDLFAQQKSRYSTTQSTPKEEVTVEEVTKEQQSKENPVTSTTSPNNQLPEEDAPVVSGEESDPAAETLDFWQREMANKAGKMRSNQPGGAASTTTPKPALFKLPSYPAIAGSFLGTPRSRSRSAQFVANVAGRGQSSWPRLETGSSTEKPAGGGTTEGGATGTTGRGAGGGGGGGGGGRGDPSPLNSFVYHRVVDGIGVGGASGPAISGFVGSSRGKQSRLPFVAITDRRLEKSLAERHKDFEQNHFPMP